MADIREQLLAAFEVEHREHVDAIRRALASPETADLREMFRRAHSLKGAARAVDLPKLEALAHSLEDQLAGLAEGRMAFDSGLIDALHLALDGIEAEAAAAREARPLADKASPAPMPAASQVPAEPADVGLEFVRLDANVLRELSRSTGSLANSVRNQGGAPGELRRLQASARQLQQSWDTLRIHLGGRESAKALDFESGLKALAKGLGELTQQQRRAAWRLETDLELLQEQLDRITLTPAEAVFGDLGRMVRDLARSAGLDVDFRVEGLETQAERRVLQALRDPVIQVLRNALSHGAETPERRRALGKPDRMLVGLTVSARGGRLLISVIDDGAGPDLAKLEAAAVERGLLQERNADNPPPTPDELLALAFEPGISSADQVDRLAGRGMGMSIVLQAIRALGGSAQLAERRPHGAKVALTAPLSTARQSVVFVEAGGAAFGLPSFGVARLMRLAQTDLESVEGVPTTRLSVAETDVVAPVVSLSALLGSASRNIPVSNGAVSAVLLARGDRRLVLAVEAFSDVRDMAVDVVVAEGIDAAVALGAALVDGDRPVTVLNPDGLLDRWLRDERRLAGAGLGVTPTAEQAPRQRTILVVDDSITTRTLEKSILEGQGYRVLLAVDGLDALHRLRGGEAIVDAVVADIEMPKMDGFSLLQAIKADAGLSHLPVILMTSRNDPADVGRGMELGAEAYITKQKFDQRELLATIGRIL